MFLKILGTGKLPGFPLVAGLVSCVKKISCLLEVMTN